MPNIAVESSNFQDAESNNQEKNFNKEAFNVSPLTESCSSSDEDENVRVREKVHVPRPAMRSGRESGREDENGRERGEQLMNGRLTENSSRVKHGRDQNMR